MSQYLSLNCSSFHTLVSLAEEVLATPGALECVKIAQLTCALIEMQNIIEAAHALPIGDLLCFDILGAEDDAILAPSPVED